MDESYAWIQAALIHTWILIVNPCHAQVVQVVLPNHSLVGCGCNFFLKLIDPKWRQTKNVRFCGSLRLPFEQN